MSQIVKAFLGVFLTLFMAVVSLSVLTAYMEVMNAQDMQARIVDELENSDFNAGVMRECFQKCADAGYELSVTVYAEGSAVSVFHTKKEVPEALENISVAKVEMHFPLKSAFLGMNQARSFVGYAR